MKKIFNLIFDRIERLYHTLFGPRTGNAVPEKEDSLNPKCIDWLQKHRNDYFFDSTCRGKAMGTENSTDVNEDEP